MVDGARLESVYTCERIVGSNPTFSAINLTHVISLQKKIEVGMKKKCVTTTKIFVIIIAICGVGLGLFKILENNKKKDVKMTDNVKNDFKEINAQHILVKTEEEALTILADIKNGVMSFQDAAKKLSQCPSGQNGGDLGYFGRNMMVPEFEAAAFVTAKDEISQPVKTSFGWHLIKIIDQR